MLDFSINWNVWTDYSNNNPPLLISTQSHAVGVELFHADRQADGQTSMSKLIVAFFNFFANVPKNLHKFAVFCLQKN